MKLKLIVILLTITSCLYAKQSITIEGRALYLKDGMDIKIVQNYPRRFSAQKKDTTHSIIKNGRFTFNIDVSGGEEYFLSVNKNTARIFLGPGIAVINIQDSTLKKIDITDNIAALEYNKFIYELGNDKLYNDYNIARKEYYFYPNRNDTTTLNDKRRKMEALLPTSKQEQIKFSLEWIKSHPQSYLNTYILYCYVLNYLPEPELKVLFQSLPQCIKDNSWGRELKYISDSLFVGNKAPNIIQADTSGKKIGLSNFKGKYVLIDFWASWCVPCRADNPYLIAAMDKFKNDNFTILGISLDSKKQLWMDAIKSDGLNWTQLSDLKTYANEASVNYYVYSIPSNFLLDPEGVIIAKNIQGNELITMLSKLVK